MRKTILLIDDDEEMCSEFQEILQEEGYSVEIALNGRTGLALIKKNSYSLVILDIKLPGINGIEVLKAVRENNIDQKILVFSGKPLDENPLIPNQNEFESTEVMMKLANDVLNKPVPVETLLSKINDLCGNKK